jgi:hypothetical protein
MPNNGIIHETNSKNISRFFAENEPHCGGDGNLKNIK